ncbi:hypothetical protein PGT21_030154 [Puccinia graminis f. sp. tritici]|uniref:Uncharacterized protein n=2 Tax=Puccinia graminis f. sp. tritici TaxID=56615 RepID=A0A5B0NFN0_PUCGR|nr:hypothetical protein PGT21_030154 [Puccinia graminis f. sp. tritici]
MSSIIEITTERQVKRMKRGDDSHQQPSSQARNSATNNSQFSSVPRPDPPMPIADYFDFCHISEEAVNKHLAKFCREQHIDRYELFECSDVMSKFRIYYDAPCGLVIILKKNVSAYREYLQALKEQESSSQALTLRRNK